MDWNTTGSKKRKENPVVSQIGYSNTSNPFNDTELTKEFEWKLRDKKLRSEGKDPVRASQDQKTHIIEDLIKAKKRRQERELFEQQLRLIRERDARLERNAADDPSLDWGQFEFDQNRKRAAIRLRENRARPIDVLYAVTQAEDDEAFRHSIRTCDPPHKLIKTLMLYEKEMLFKELKTFLKNDYSHASYWKSLLIITDHEIQVAKTEEKSMHKEILSDIKAILKGKTEAELETLEKSIRQKVESQSENLDVEYWDRLLLLLSVKKAKLQSKSFFLNVKASLGSKHEPKTPEDSPPPMSTSTTKVDMFQKETEKRMGDGEEAFNLDIPMQKEYPWQDLYKSRKPNFFNRVIKGYDWNRYNQTHFTTEEPPPPTIRGYRFNIFYPDLVDPNLVPSFSLHEADSLDEMIIVFRTGPPYEDIAFKIHKADWDYSRKTGFRCSFENGVLRLWFNFKRYRYRR